MIEVPIVPKSPDAFRTISEVATELDVPQHVLRFWESKFTQIRPLKRGGGRRYYRPDDIDLLRGIQKLLYSDGYTIKGVQKVFREKGVKFVVAAGNGSGEAGAAPAEAPASVPAEEMDSGAEVAATQAPATVAGAPTSAVRAQAPMANGTAVSLSQSDRATLKTALKKLGDIKAKIAAARLAKSGAQGELIPDVPQDDDRISQTG